MVDVWSPAPTLNVVSIVPLVFNLTIPLIEDPLYVVNSPMAIIFQSDCTRKSRTTLLNPVPTLNVVSRVPFWFNLVIRFILDPL